MLNKIKKSLLSYLVITIICGLISFIYEYFSHGVYSNFMVYSFTIPLLLGVIPSLLALLKPICYFNSWLQKILHNFGIATLYFGSFLQGVVEIYGTSSNYTIYYLIAGIVLLFLSIIIHFNPNFAKNFDK